MNLDLQKTITETTYTLSIMDSNTIFFIYSKFLFSIEDYKIEAR